MTNEIIPFEMNQEINVLTGNEPQPYVSFDVKTQEDAIRLYNAMNSPEIRLNQMINKTINMVDAVLVPCALTNSETGEIQNGVRSIIIDDKGHSYSATSTGIMTSLRNLNAVFKTLHFEPPLKVTVKQVSVKKGNTLTLELE